MIPAGYQLHIKTWENDGDARKTKVISGLEKEEVEFFIEIAKRFASRNSPEKGIGNGSATGDQLKEIVKTALDNHPHISDELRNDVESCFDDEDLWDAHLYEYITDRILGFPENEIYRSDFENFCRVYDSHKVYYYPQAVEEVTEKFK